MPWRAAALYPTSGPLLGGTLVLSKEGKVVHEFRETSSFYQGEAADLLAAVHSLNPPVAPAQADVCD